MTAPDHWTETTLGEIIKLKPGRYLKKNDYAAGGPFSVYGSNSVMGSHTKPLYDGPLIVMAGVGNAGAVRLSMDPCWVNNNAFAIFTSGTTRTEYLYYWLDTQLDLGLVRLGTVQPYIHKDHLKAIPITLPPPPRAAPDSRLTGRLASPHRLVHRCPKNPSRCGPRHPHFAAARTPQHLTAANND